MSRILVNDLHKKWMKDPAYRHEYAALDEEFSLIAALLEARTCAGLTQEQVAQRMQTTQTVIAASKAAEASLPPAPCPLRPSHRFASANHLRAGIRTAITVTRSLYTFHPGTRAHQPAHDSRTIKKESL